MEQMEEAEWMINPDPKQSQLQELKESAVGLRALVDLSRSCKVETTENQKTAISLIGNARRLLKSIDEKRKDSISDEQSWIKRVNNCSAEFTDQLKEMDKSLAKKAHDFGLRCLELKEADSFSYEGNEKVVRSEGANMYFREEWTYEVANVEEVPKQYLMINPEKIEEAIGCGMRKIDGLSIYKKIVSQVRCV